MRNQIQPKTNNLKQVIIKAVVKSLFLLLTGMAIGAFLIYSNEQAKGYKDQIVKLNDNIKQLDYELNTTKQLLEHTDPDEVILKLTKQSIALDLDTFKHLSTREKSVIYSAVIEASKKYEINPLVIYSILYSESTFRAYLKHADITLTIDNKKIKTNAIGLGGIVWEWWGKDLIAEGIAETKDDLFDPKTNIYATAYVYKVMYSREKLKSAESQGESALMRYFGGEYKWYAAKINTKMINVINDIILK